MIPVILFLLSIGLQLAAALFALLLIRVTDRKLAWVLLSLAMVLMAWRRAVSFAALITAGKTVTFDLPEFIALIISALMLAGVLRIGAYFRLIRTAQAERDRAMEEAREGAVRFRTLADSGQALIWTSGTDKKCDYFNQSWLLFTGRTLEQELGDGWAEGVHPDDLESCIETYCSAFDRRERFSLIYRLRRHDGEYRWIQDDGLPSFDSQGNFLGYIGHCLDITERKQSEEALKKHKERLEVAEAHAGLGSWEFDVKSGEGWWSRQMYEMVGFDPRQGIPAVEEYLDHIHPDDRLLIRDVLMRMAQGQEPPVQLFRSNPAQGPLRYFSPTVDCQKDANGRAIKFAGTLLDVTERRMLEAQYLQAQKMESIGTLAGGVAHDFNNILTAIIGYAHIALMQMSGDDPQRKNIQQILAGADRAAHLTKELLLFSRKQVSELKTVDLNDIIRKVEKFLSKIIGEDISCRTILMDRPILVNADGNQLEQVLLNLAANARDSMPGGGSFTVLTELIDLKEDFIRAHGYGRTGPFALMTISDSGKGMDEEMQKHIFEPFFTTKEVGKGTGLGLAVVYGIIKQHEGFINVYSEPGKGTTFRIYLPITLSSAGEETEAPQPASPSRGTETVLVAEDDEALRKLAKTVLTQFGYTVIEAVDGEDAVKKFVENHDRIHLLLFDLVMPGMNGKEACDEIRKMTPDMKVIFSSGYAPDLVRQKMLLDEGTHLIYKPVSPMELLRAVRSALDEQR